MTNKMVVAEETLSTRHKAEQLVRDAHAQGCDALDLARVEFMTRSVADELRYFEARDEIELVNLTGDAEEMYELVRAAATTA